MIVTFHMRDFVKVPGVEDAYYCPACNASGDDADLPACGKMKSGWVCGNYGTGQGSLSWEGVLKYLQENRPTSERSR